MKDVFALCFFFIFILGCSNEAKKDGSKHQASLRLNWIPSCSFAGEVAGAKRFAGENDIDISLEFGGAGLDPIKMVQSGVNTFGCAGVDLVLVANDKGADLVIIGVVSNQSPGVWLAKKEKNIRTINDVKGLRIGELPGGNMQYLYEVFLRRTGLQRGVDFEPVAIPYELKNFITQDNCDLRPVFIYDETSELDLRGIEYTVLEPKDYGVDFMGICYFAKRRMIKDSPDLVQAFINTMAKGWEYALENKQEAISHLKEHDPSIRIDKELLGLKRGMSYLSGYEGRALDSEFSLFHGMVEIMKSMGYIRDYPNIKEVVNLKFVKSYYKNGRQLRQY